MGTPARAPSCDRSPYPAASGVRHGSEGREIATGPRGDVHESSVADPALHGGRGTPLRSGDVVYMTPPLLGWSYVECARFPGARASGKKLSPRSRACRGQADSYNRMMRPEELRGLLRRRPFVPIRLYLTDGMTYDIRHPEMAILTRSTVNIGLEGQEGSGIADEMVYCSLVHIVRVKNLNGTAAE